MIAIVKESIEIVDYTPEVYNYFAKQLTFDNPDYERLVRLGKWTGNTPKTLSMIQRAGNKIIIPFGMLKKVFSLSNLFEQIANETNTGDYSVDFRESISLYPYQENAVTEALRAKNGVIVAPCGAGKTQIGLAVVARLKKRTLWLTHTVDLLNQSMMRAKELFDLPDCAYGTITAGKIDLGTQITFATVQTMARIDLTKLRDYWDCVVVDECHHVAGTPTRLTQFYRVISSLNARWKFGLTATPKRQDGLTDCMFALLGEKICEITKEDTKNTTVPVSVLIRKTEYVPAIDRICNPDGTINYTKLISDLVRNEQRNQLIVADVKAFDRPRLILTDRVAHGEILQQMLICHGVNALFISQQSKADRKKILSALNDGEIDCLIATWQLAKEGLDVPNLRRIYFVTPQKNATTIIQACGRVERKGVDKTEGEIVDYVDGGLFSGWAKKRRQIYTKNNYKIVDK